MYFGVKSWDFFMADRMERHPPILRKLPIAATANSSGTGKFFSGNDGNLSKNGDSNYFSFGQLQNLRARNFGLPVPDFQENP
jgi:hypothetical protein